MHSIRVFILFAFTIMFALKNSAAVFNVRDYGATGNRSDDARQAFQKAIDSCGAAGGGTVLVPQGEYTSGTLHLRSHVHLQFDPGSILYASPEAKDYDCGPIATKAALLFGEDLEDVAIGGQGVIDGQAEYEWRPDDFEHGFDNKTLMQKMGKSLMRPFPKGHPKRDIFPHILWLGRSKDIRVTGVNMLHAFSWTVTLYACDRAVFEDLYIYTSLREAVWADGIDLDGCQDVSISHCTIETGDDCVAFVSQNWFGPPRTCQNVVVKNCRFSSASAGVKFSEGNFEGIRNIQISDTLFNHVNRGVVFANTLGGDISGVVLSNLTINCDRFGWFWAGDGQPFRFRITRLSEFNEEPAKPGEAAPGVIRDIVIRNVVARAKGSSLIQGHKESWLDGITIENFRLYVSADPFAPYDKAENALDFRRARNLKLKDVQVFWEEPSLKTWKSALYFEDVSAVDIEKFAGRQAWPGAKTPAVMLNQVSDARISQCRAPEGTGTFLGLTGATTKAIRLGTNDMASAKTPWHASKEVSPAEVFAPGRQLSK
jgi:hypothetical protein